MIMKFILMLTAVAGLVLAGCSKSGDDNMPNPPKPPATNAPAK
jgi:nitrous oxide reductase accessory protein NosL